MQSQSRRVSREELFQMVWETPMSRLAEEFGISGNGLAKICDRMDVPYPPRGYWAKKHAGKPVVILKLPPRKADVPELTEIYPTPPKPAVSPEGEQSSVAIAQKIEGISVPDNLEDLHPRIKAWMAEHKTSQKEREQEAKRNRHDSWYARRLLSDLTERDLYRFRVTSALFKAIEKAGGKIEQSPISGRVTFQIGGHEVACVVVEKMLKSLKQYDETRTWTAYPDHHQSGLESSGFLRIAVTTYLSGIKPQWVETKTAKIGDLLPEVISTIMTAGPILDRMKREREEREKQYREEEARRYERQRQRELDQKRWEKFCELADNWKERERLLLFLAEIEKRAGDETGAKVGESALAEWMAWARARTEALDPFHQGVAGLFEEISEVTR